MAWTLGHLVTATWAALADGELSWSRARALAEEVNRHGPEVDPHVVATVEAVVLPQAAELPVGRLRALVRREFLRHDADAAEQRRPQARAAADVFLRRSAHDGMSEVVTSCPSRPPPPWSPRWTRMPARPRPTAIRGRSGRSAPRCMADLTLRPWDDTRPAVTAELRVLAPLNSLLPDPSDPAVAGRPRGVAEVDGEPITAGTCGHCSPLSTPSAPADCRRPPVGRCTSTCSAPAAPCWRP